MSMTVVKTQNLKLGYGNHVVLQDINIEIKQNSIVTLVGPNGAGKSTLLKAVAGQLNPLDGEVYVLDEALKDKSRNKLATEIAIASARESVRETINCFDMVAMGRYPYTGFLGKLSDNDITLVNEIMDLTATGELAETNFNDLSDGQKQRIILARALCQQPKILVLDEPTTYLDVKYKLEFLSLLKRLSKEQGFTVLMSLHELDLARQISDEIICIKDSRVLRQDCPDNIFEQGFINELFNIKVGTYDEEKNIAIIDGGKHDN